LTLWAKEEGERRDFGGTLFRRLQGSRVNYPKRKKKKKPVEVIPAKKRRRRGRTRQFGNVTKKKKKGNEGGRMDLLFSGARLLTDARFIIEKDGGKTRHRHNAAQKRDLLRGKARRKKETNNTVFEKRGGRGARVPPRKICDTVFEEKRYHLGAYGGK